MSRSMYYGIAQVIKGDRTTHGGVVLTGAPNNTWNGIPVARVGDLVYCPKCKPHFFKITKGFNDATDMNIQLAGHGHLTGCGATLIAESAPASFFAAAQKLEMGLSKPEKLYDELLLRVYPDKLSSFGNVMAFIERVDGKPLTGIEIVGLGHPLWFASNGRVYFAPSEFEGSYEQIKMYGAASGLYKLEKKVVFTINPVDAVKSLNNQMRVMLDARLVNLKDGRALGEDDEAASWRFHEFYRHAEVRYSRAMEAILSASLSIQQQESIIAEIELHIKEHSKEYSANHHMQF